jgi:hypothetical protein
MKGQISLDLILTIAVALVAVGSVSVLGQSIFSMQADDSVKQQLDDIGTGLAEIISVSAVLEDADSARVEYDIPGLLVPGEGRTQPCEIQIGGGNIRLSYERFDREAGTSTIIFVDKKYIEPAGMSVPATASCGSRIELSNMSFDTGWLCIQDYYAGRGPGGSPISGPRGTADGDIIFCSDTYYVLGGGWIEMSSPAIPGMGIYRFDIEYRSGTPGQAMESFKVVCGAMETEIPDEAGPDIWRTASVLCDFGPGSNTTRIESTAPAGDLSSIHFSGFRISG